MPTIAKILYVDDELLNLRLFQINFKTKYEVLTAYNGVEGLEVLEKNPDIAVVISDMKMPNMNGIQFIKKAKEKYPDMNYYILTGFEITNEIREALDAKLILKYFQKPFNLNEIDSTIKSALDQ